jgi:hypothetical protein
MYKKADNMPLNVLNGLGLVLADRLGIGADRYMSGVQTVNDTANNIRSGAQRVGSAVKNGLASVGDYIDDAGQAVSDAYGQYYTDLTNGAKGIAESAEDKISKLKDKGAGIATQLEFVGDALADRAKNVVQKGKRAGKKVAERASAAADAAVKAAPGVVNTVERTLADAGNAAAEAGKNMLNAGRDAAKTVGTAASDAAKTVGTAAGDAADFIREGVGGLKYMVTNPFTGINAYDKARNDASHATLENLAAIEAGINRQNQEGIEVADQNAAYKKARRTAIAKEMQRIREETARETSPVNIAKDTVNNVVDNVKNTAQDAVGRIRGLFGPSEEELRKQRFKQLLMQYAPWTVGGALVGGVTGGLIGSRHKKTLLGSILGSVGGAGLATAGKYAYDKYMNKHASADYIDHRVRLKQKLQANYK